MAELIARLRRDYGVTIGELDLGGGHAVPYLADDDQFDLTGFAHRLRVAVHYECQAHRLPTPKLIIEPGRSIVVTAGIPLASREQVFERFLRLQPARDRTAGALGWVWRSCATSPRATAAGPGWPMTRWAPNSTCVCC